MKQTKDSEETTHLLSVEEVAERLGLSRSFVYREISAGHIQAFKLGRRIKVAEHDLQTYLQQHLIQNLRAKRRHF